jgi:hypothetical protein
MAKEKEKKEEKQKEEEKKEKKEGEKGSQSDDLRFVEKLEEVKDATPLLTKSGLEKTVNREPVLLNAETNQENSKKDTQYSSSHSSRDYAPLINTLSNPSMITERRNLRTTDEMSALRPQKISSPRIEQSHSMHDSDTIKYGDFKDEREISREEAMGGFGIRKYKRFIN